EETLRDGIQSSELSMLNTEDKKKVIKNFDNAGIEGCCIGFINSSKKENDEINELFQFIITNKLKIVPAVLCRLLIEDFKEIKNIVQCNLFNQLKVYTYIAVSPIRMKVENWSEEIIIEKIIDFLNYCQMENAKITIAFEDASRADKSFLKKLIEIINNYPLVKSVVIADTVGTCNYNSTRD
ncbi:TPA: histone-lysine N-methyltransferase, partial [Streptococcus pneumoniae]